MTTKQTTEKTHEGYKPSSVTTADGEVIQHLSREEIICAVDDDPARYGNLKVLLDTALADTELIGLAFVKMPMLEKPVSAPITAKGEYDLGSVAYACLAEGSGEEKLVFTPDEMERWKSGTHSGRGQALAHSWLRSDDAMLEMIAENAEEKGEDLPYRVTEYGTAVGDWDTAVILSLHMTGDRGVAKTIDRYIELGGGSDPKLHQFIKEGVVKMNHRTLH